MLARLSIVAGLVLGVAAAGLLLGGILALAPEAPPPSVVAPSSAPETAVPSAVAAATPAPSASGSSARPDAASLVGQAAPPLVVPQVGGDDTIDLADFAGLPVWIDFVSTACPSCQGEFSLMNGFAARLADEGLVVIAIDVGEEESAVAAFEEGSGASFPFGLDRDRAAADAWGVGALPTHLWVDADGVVRHVASGGIGADDMVAGLKSIMPGVDVTP